MGCRGLVPGGEGENEKRIPEASSEVPARECWWSVIPKCVASVARAGDRSRTMGSETPSCSPCFFSGILENLSEQRRIRSMQFRQPRTRRKLDCGMRRAVVWAIGGSRGLEVELKPLLACSPCGNVSTFSVCSSGFVLVRLLVRVMWSSACLFFSCARRCACLCASCVLVPRD